MLNPPCQGDLLFQVGGQGTASSSRRRGHQNRRLIVRRVRHQLQDMVRRVRVRTGKHGGRASRVKVPASNPAVPSAVARCCLTPRSRGPPAAGHQARAGGTLYIFTAPGLASCRWLPLSSNVSRQMPPTRYAGTRA